LALFVARAVGVGAAFGLLLAAARLALEAILTVVVRPALRPATIVPTDLIAAAVGVAAAVVRDLFADTGVTLHAGAVTIGVLFALLTQTVDAEELPLLLPLVALSTVFIGLAVRIFRTATAQQ
jgi:energy-converting hydrogenase Eha subunit A